MIKELRYCYDCESMTCNCDVEGKEVVGFVEYAPDNDSQRRDRTDRDNTNGGEQ